METPNQNISQQARAHFLHQGQSIAKLHDLLNSNILTHHLGKWLSVILEISLYLLILIIVLLALQIPLNIHVTIPSYDNSMVNLDNNNKNVAMFVLLLQFIVILSALPLFLFARLLARNRKKSKLIREAYLEAEKMKQAFDVAVKDLHL